MQIRDLTNMVFGRLTVVSMSGNDKFGRKRWLCKCKCGVEKVVSSTNLVEGITKSCGCLLKEKMIDAFVTHGQCKVGETTPEYRAWISMKARCYNVLNCDYKNYGGRGIIVCDRWLNSFDLFFKDMGERPSTKHSMDRFPDVNGNYEPTNCRWATQSQQQGNRRNNVWLEFEGKRMIQAIVGQENLK